MGAAAHVPVPPAAAAGSDEHAAFLDAWRRFNRATQRAKARRCETGDLSLTQALLLSGLLDAPALTVGALADSAGVAKPTATRMLDGLERDGYVERRQSGTDRRAVLVSLTPAGARALNERWAALRDSLERASAALAPAEREQATALLLRLADLLDELN